MVKLANDEAETITARASIMSQQHDDRLLGELEAGCTNHSTMKMMMKKPVAPATRLTMWGEARNSCSSEFTRTE